MKQQPKINWKKLWRLKHRRAFRLATTLPAEHLNGIQDEIKRRIERGSAFRQFLAWWRQQTPPQGWGVKS